MLTNNLTPIGNLGNLQVSPNPKAGVFFVNSSGGQDSRGRVSFPGGNATSITGGSTQGPQVDPAYPLATLTYALTLTLAGRGDQIIIQQGHTETLTADITCSTAGTEIYGLGIGDERPLFTMGGYSIILSGVGSLMLNCRQNAGTTANITGSLQLTGAGTSSNNKIIGANVTSVGVLLGANRTVYDGEISGTTTGFATGVLFGVFDECVIGPNANIHGIFANAPVVCVANTNMIINGPILRQLHATVKPVITGIVTATSGFIINGRFQSIGATTAAEFFDGANVATNILVIYLQNFGFKGKAGPSSGILVPAVGTIP